MSEFRACLYLLFCSLFIFLGDYNTSSAQGSAVYYDNKQYVVKQWNNDDGLPQNTIFDIVKDEIGYLWISTEEGLVRFDGNEFLIYDSQRIPDLPSNYFTDISHSSTGGILAVSRYAILKVEEYSSELYDLRPYLDNSIITAITEGNDGQFWIGTQSGRIFMMSPKKLKRTIYGTVIRELFNI